MPKCNKQANTLTLSYDADDQPIQRFHGLIKDTGRLSAVAIHEKVHHRGPLILGHCLFIVPLNLSYCDNGQMHAISQLLIIFGLKK
jgi:hypothetical protein